MCKRQRNENRSRLSRRDAASTPSDRRSSLFGDAPHYDELRLLAQTMDDKLTTGVGFYNIEDPETIKRLVEVARQHASVQSFADPEVSETSTSHGPLKAHS